MLIYMFGLVFWNFGLESELLKIFVWMFRYRESYMLVGNG